MPTLPVCCKAMTGCMEQAYVAESTSRQEIGSIEINLQCRIRAPSGKTSTNFRGFVRLFVLGKKPGRVLTERFPPGGTCAFTSRISLVFLVGWATEPVESWSGKNFSYRRAILQISGYDAALGLLTACLKHHENSRRGFLKRKGLIFIEQ